MRPRAESAHAIRDDSSGVPRRVRPLSATLISIARGSPIPDPIGHLKSEAVLAVSEACAPAGPAGTRSASTRCDVGIVDVDIHRERFIRFVAIPDPADNLLAVHLLGHLLVTRRRLRGEAAGEEQQAEGDGVTGDARCSAPATTCPSRQNFRCLVPAAEHVVTGEQRGVIEAVEDVVPARVRATHP